jgi:hypothetical protein
MYAWQCKIFSTNVNHLENEINEFLSDIITTDIKLEYHSNVVILLYRKQN